MSAEWLISQLVLKAKSQEALIAMLPPDLVASITTGPSITSLPIDILAQVLSYICKSDIRNVRLTCVAFAHAMRKQHFWYPFIQQALNYCIKQRNITNQSEARNILAFNTFESPVAETLRAQVEWVFKPLKWTKFSCQKNKQYVERCTHLSTNLENAFVLGTNTLQNVIWYESARFNDDDGRFISIGKGDNPFLRIEMQKGIHDKAVGSKKVTELNAVFDGNLVWKGEKWLPHGNGKWTFSDGSVLEGNDVASMGEPRFILQKEEWESVLKKRKIENE